MNDIYLVQKFFKMKKEHRDIQNKPNNLFDILLANCLINVHKKGATEYKPSSLEEMVSSVDRKL